jgi:hypothetical protein
MTEKQVKETEDGIAKFLGWISASVVAGFMINYSLFSFLEKDVWFGFDMCTAFLLLFFLRFKHLNLGGLINALLFIIAFVGRVMLEYPVPLIK